MGFDYFYGFTHARHRNGHRTGYGGEAGEAVENQPLMIDRAEYLNPGRMGEAAFLSLFPLYDRWCPQNDTWAGQAKKGSYAD